MSEGCRAEVKRRRAKLPDNQATARHASTFRFGAKMATVTDRRYNFL